MVSLSEQRQSDSEHNTLTQADVLGLKLALK